MNLVRSEWGMNIVFQENKVVILVIENPEVMLETVLDFFHQSQGEEGKLALCDNGEMCSFEKKAELILNPFSIDLNSKKIRLKLYHELKREADEGYYQEYLKLVSEIQRYLEQIARGLLYPINYKTELQVVDLLKVCDVGIEEESGAFEQKIAEYMKLVRQLCGVELIVFVNIKAYLREEQILELYKTAFYYNIKVLMIENQSRKLLDNEKLFIIDSDKCLIEC